MNKNLISYKNLFKILNFKQNFNIFRTIHDENINIFDDQQEKFIPKTKNEFKNFDWKISNSEEQPENPKLIQVSIIGCPNAGKSTLLNQLINWRVSAVSSKVHTTRKNVIGIHVENDTQVVFFDTPGVISKRHMLRHKLEMSFLNDLKYSVENSDLLTILTDVSNPRERSRLNKGILEILNNYPQKESILVLNKVDLIKDKRSFLDIVSNLTCGIVGGEPVNVDDSETEMIKLGLKHGNFEPLFKRTEKHYFNYQDNQPANDTDKLSKIENKTGWPNFSRVFMISALHDDGIDQLRNYFIQKAKLKSWKYNGKVVTLQSPQKLIIEAIREVCLETFQQEIPYNLRFKIVMWEIDDLGNLFLVIDIYIQEKFLSLLIGPKGTTISNIVNKSRESIANIFRCDVSLKIAAKSYR